MLHLSLTRVKNEHSFYNRRMPRVSEAHLAARRRQILEAARVCFLRNGFHATSMQDVIREAGLSVGAVYRYFPSKYELVTALAGQVVGNVTRVFREQIESAPSVSLAAAMQRAVDTIEEETGPDGVLRLAIQVWSESLRDPVLAEFVAKTYASIRDVFVDLARRAIATGELPATADPDAVGPVLFAMLPGYGLQRVLIGTPDAATYKEGLQTVLGRAAG